MSAGGRHGRWGRRVGASLLASLLALAFAVPARSREFQDLPHEVRGRLIEAARAYFELGSQWSDRKAFRAELHALAEGGTDPLADMELLRDIVNQGRVFLPAFSDRDWRRANDIEDFRKIDGLYFTVSGPNHRWSWTEPDGMEAAADPRRERAPPFPLLLALHDPEDLRDDHPGAAVLRRRYPEHAFDDLYEQWFALAPVAAGAPWVDPATRLLNHEALTQRFVQFRQRYPLDFERVVLDGGADAAAIAAAMPYQFAGLVLRGGPVDEALVPNYAHVPVFVVGDAALSVRLRDAGHPDVTLGESDAVWAWLQARRRTTPTTFTWQANTPDHVVANWISLLETDWTAEARTVDVRVDREANTITLDTRGILRLLLYLNDDVVDLDKDVVLVWNAEERVLGRLERDFNQLFDREPPVRKNMILGWLYPTVTEPLDAPGVLAEGPNPGEPPSDLALTPEERAEIEWAFLIGRLDEVRRRVGGAVGAVDRFPLALLELWWRRPPHRDVDEVTRAYAQLLEGAEGITRLRLLWLLGDAPEAAYPVPKAGGQDPWPVLTALVEDRLRRERRGPDGLPEDSRLLADDLAVLPRYREDFDRWRAYLTEVHEVGFEGERLEHMQEAHRDRVQEGRDRARRLRTRNAWAAALTVAALLAVVLLLIRRTGRRPQP